VKRLPDETFESWAHRVRTYEYGVALQKVATGTDINLVMEDMGRRIVDKLKHHVIAVMKEQFQVTYDPVQSQRVYREEYLERKPPAPDHVTED
jgi:glutamyl-tRNA reductase